MSIRIAVVLAVVFFSCAPPSTGAPRDNPNVITEAQIAEAQGANVYEVISRVRPAFLRSRGTGSMSSGSLEYAEVYRDGMRVGGIGTLRSMPIGGVREIRYYNLGDATMKFGSGHTGGVIEVMTR